uniref:Uncharacterized protein n=1 Tax=Acrobeloides nanus TaxID=290746 RepID=A0A914D8S6_9BILA
MVIAAENLDEIHGNHDPQEYISRIRRKRNTVCQTDCWVKKGNFCGTCKPKKGYYSGLVIAGYNFNNCGKDYVCVCC